MDAPDNTQSKTRHILLVDDDAEHVALVRKLLDEAQGDYALDIASNFDDAVGHLEQNRHDVFLVGEKFEDDRGLEIVWDITGRGCKGPAILISPEDSYEREAEAVNLGAMVFLVWNQLQQPRFTRSSASTRKTTSATIRKA